jgi:hypothetical protein
MNEHVVFKRRFHGPPESGNGGYVSGVIASLLGGAAEITLRRPVPLDTPLEVHRRDDGIVAILEGETLIAQGAPSTVDIDVPEPVSLARAEAASRAFAGLQNHVFPSCFVCGPQRPEGEGLRIFPGPIDGRDVVAAPWTAHPSLAGDEGQVQPEFLWSALDCTGGWAFHARSTTPLVLGRMTAKLIRPVQAGERLVVIGWPIGSEGRKALAGSAVFSGDRRLHALAKATWITVPGPIP